MLANARELAGGEPIAVHEAAGAFQAQHNLIRCAEFAEQNRDFFAQLVDRAGAKVAVKIQHEEARPGLGLSGVVFELPLRRPGFGFALFLVALFLGATRFLAQGRVQGRLAQRIAQGFIAIVELANFDMPLALGAIALTEGGNQHDQQSDSRDNGQGLGQKQAVLSEKIHSFESVTQGRYEAPDTA